MMIIFLDKAALHTRQRFTAHFVSRQCICCASPPTACIAWCPALVTLSRNLSSVQGTFAVPFSRDVTGDVSFSAQEECVTPGALIPIPYLRSKAWTAYFASLYRHGVQQVRRKKGSTSTRYRSSYKMIGIGREQHQCGESKEGKVEGEQVLTAPLFQCPLCFSHLKAKLDEVEYLRNEVEEDVLVDDVGPSYADSSHQLSQERQTEDEIHTTGHRSVMDVVPWRSPLEMMQHMSYCHMSSGFAPHEFKPYNDHVLMTLMQRIQEGKRREKEKKNDNDSGGKRGEVASVNSSCSTSCTTSCSPLPRRRLRLLVWVDVANIDLGANEVFLEMLSSTALRGIFSNIPIGWCTAQELFVPHTCATLHGVYQLRLRHRDSEVFPFYAATRSESGDLTMSSLISRLRLAACFSSSPCHHASRLVVPPMVLLTLDARQRQSVTELFGTGKHGGAVVTPYGISASALYHAFLDALGSGVGI